MKTKIRDIAIITLFLGTGIRVSECVGLDITDINFRENSIRIVRKGGNESILYFGDEVEKALLDYIEGPRAMMAMKAVPGEENTLFFSLQKKRISVHAVENLVEKYAKEFVPHKKITPHKLRSTLVQTCIRKQGTFIWWRMFWVILMSEQRRSTMQRLKTRTGGRRLWLLGCGKINRRFY